ncbi:major facilitator superfamily domain-containing protein [Naematelia encephala]|uniref:Major facilitator superfamily domain-containing protein n=1 Tax=Naematelia encephala TaxID=71784 RepID=A0A1Y2AZJ0_9TREE|nr:major facilitator superfamily domain-containing protein [Naematelia encephala]
MEAYRQYLAFTPRVPPVSEKIGPSSEPLGCLPDQSTPIPSCSQNTSQATVLDDVANAFSSSRQREDDAQTPIYVTFDKGDPADPHNWSHGYKACVIGLLTHLTLSLTFASSVSAPTTQALMDEFNCGEIAATATTGLFLVGMGLGAMPAAPLSELHGRLPIYVGSLIIATLFEIACALAPSIGALIVLRFLAGFFSAAPLSNAGGSLNDVGRALSRTLTLPMFATTGFLGPLLGPLIGGFIVENDTLGWRWAFWIAAIWNAFAFGLVVVFMPETLGHALLKYKAVRLRKVTGDMRWKAKVEDETLVEATVRSLKRPFLMLALEPIVIMFVLYLTIVYIVLFGSFTAYPLIFQTHGLTLAQTGLTYIPIMVGFLLLLGIVSGFYTRYRRLTLDAKSGKQRKGIFDGRVEPEERLMPLMACGSLFPAGLFWLAWTSASHHSIWLTMMSGVPFGIGLLSIFQGSYQYMIDAYGPFASSALAGATLVRYLVSGLVILAFPKMYSSLGNQWATTLLAFLGVAMTPVPFFFYIYGRRIRDSCRFTVRD